jgi:hypothetical protein
VPGVRGEGVKKKRWTIKLALCLLAGAVVTWGVAWGCAIESDRRPPQRDQEFVMVFEGDTLWGAVLFRGLPGFDRYSVLPPEAVGLDVFKKPVMEPILLGVRQLDRPNWMRFQGAGAEITRFGWPCRALSRESQVDFNNRVLHMNSLELGSTAGIVRLPLLILPLGFALNTLFYAAALLGAVECVAFARRRVRRGRGRCPSCGYDRAGLAEGSACPECGGKETRYPPR